MRAFMCCMARAEDKDSGGAGCTQLKRAQSWQNIPNPDEFLIFHECAESFEELELLRTIPTERMLKEDGDVQRVPSVIREQTAFLIARQVSFERLESTHDDSNRRSPGARRSFIVLRPTAACSSTAPAPTNGSVAGSPTGGHRGTPGPHEDSIPHVQAAVQERWRRRRERGDLDEGLAALLEQEFHELDDWTEPPTVRRMLRAMGGDEEEAASLLCRAIESRVRRRELYRVMRCPGELASDVRVIGRDTENRLTIYMCARNQQGGLKEMVPQLFLAFEAAVRLSDDRADGQIVLVADMHDLAARPNMDLAAFQELQESFGSVYADRLNFMLIIDFSWVAQTLWSMCKPFLSERTKKKLTFVDEERARDIVQERFPKCTRDRLLSAFDINREPDSTDAERQAHALRTSICDVPLGCAELRSLNGTLA